MAFYKGERVVLEHTNDPHTHLKPGDKGTVTSCQAFGSSVQVCVAWDSGSSLAMLPESGDRIRVIREG